MDTLLKLTCPVTLSHLWQGVLFLFLPCFGAALGARLLQGSFLRIAGAALGAGLRDLVIMACVASSWIQPQPEYNGFASVLMLYLACSGAALGAVFSPYRGPALWLMSALGTGLGQWLFLPLSRVLLALGLAGCLWKTRTKAPAGIAT